MSITREEIIMFRNMINNELPKLHTINTTIANLRKEINEIKQQLENVQTLSIYNSDDINTLIQRYQADDNTE